MILFNYQTQDAENVRDNFKKIAQWTNNTKVEIVVFEDEDSVVIEWNSDRIMKFGPFPNLQLWTLFDGVYYKDDVQGNIDNPPPDMTSITFDFLTKTGFQASGFIIIK